MYWRTAWLGSLFVSSCLHLCDNSQHSSQHRFSMCVFSASKEGKWIRHLPLQFILIRSIIATQLYPPSPSCLSKDSLHPPWISLLVTFYWLLLSLVDWAFGHLPYLADLLAHLAPDWEGSHPLGSLPRSVGWEEWASSIVDSALHPGGTYIC